MYLSKLKTLPVLTSPLCKQPPLFKGNRAFADLRYGELDSISPSTLMFAAKKG